MFIADSRKLSRVLFGVNESSEKFSILHFFIKLLQKTLSISDCSTRGNLSLGTAPINDMFVFND